MVWLLVAQGRQSTPLQANLKRAARATAQLENLPIREESAKAEGKFSIAPEAAPANRH
jgi:hypothetical protein